MPFYFWLRKRASKRQHRPPARALSPRLEVLEARDVPSFGPVVSYPLGTPPQAVVTADINQDGKLDLITADPVASSVSVMLGKGNGTFSAPGTFAVEPAPVSVAVGDVNGDGRPDIVAVGLGDSGYSVSTLPGNGDGTFGSAQY